jgi:hypothetical protein
VTAANFALETANFQFDFSERHDRCGQVVERQEAALKLFVSRQQLSEAV